MDQSVRKVVRFDRFVLDFTRGCLRLGEQEIDLPPKAFQVLSYLALNAGRLVPKQELLDTVWAGVVVTDESLVQSIRQLRQKLGDEGHRLIKTVPRRGYLLDVPIAIDVASLKVSVQAANPSNEEPAFPGRRVSSIAADGDSAVTANVLSLASITANLSRSRGALRLTTASTMLIAIALAFLGLSQWLAKSKRVEMMPKGWEAAAPALLATPAQPEQRVALLIGNTNYKTWGMPLKNPRNDVAAVGQQLRALGFATTIVYDGRSDQIAAAIEDFRREAEDADWAIIYYAGAGIEVDGENYMVPIDADASRAPTFTHDYPKMRLETAFESVKRAKRLRLVITDACRIDPATQNQAGAHRSVFKVVEPPRGVLVAYSTAAGQEAIDGPGGLSPYAAAFIAGLHEPGIEMPMVFRRISAEVEAVTKGVQAPTVLGNWPAERLYVSAK
jgi:DNA-binding winged helix-turn-helix (wHTH) protein